MDNTQTTLIIVLIAILAGAGLWYALGNQNAPAPAAVTATTTDQSAATTTQDTAAPAPSAGTGGSANIAGPGERCGGNIVYRDASGALVIGDIAYSVAGRLSRTRNLLEPVPMAEAAITAR